MVLVGKNLDKVMEAIAFLVKAEETLAEQVAALRAAKGLQPEDPWPDDGLVTDEHCLHWWQLRIKEQRQQLTDFQEKREIPFVIKYTRPSRR